MSDLNKKHIVQLYRTSENGKLVDASGVTYGELAMNYNSESPMLMLKDNTDNIQIIGSITNTTGTSEYKTMSQKAITDAINGLDVEHKLSDSYSSIVYPTLEETNGVVFTAAKSGDDLDTVIGNLDANVSTLLKETLKNEDVVAAALTEINTSAGFDTNAKYIVNSDATYINNAISLADADNILDSAIKNISDVTNKLVTDGDGTSYLANDGTYKPIEHKLSEEYLSVTYATEEETDGIIFTAAKSGDDLDTAIFNLDTNVSTLLNETLKNEEVVAAALTEVKENCGLDINMQYIVNENGAYISAATTLAEADNILDNNLKSISDEVDNISTIVSNIVTDGDGESYLANDGTYKPIEHKLSDSYVQVVYPTKTGNITFTPASSGQSLDDAIKTVDTNVSNLVNAVLDNEQVIAAALTKHNESCGFDINGNYITYLNGSYISTSSNLTDADIALDNGLNELTERINELEAQLNNSNIITTLQNKVTELENILNRVIVAVGLNAISGDTYGTYVVPTTAETSGYTTASTSVMNAVILMDNQIEENETVTAYSLTDLNNRVNNIETELNQQLEINE